jgi:epoxyqueuosine reductase
MMVTLAQVQGLAAEHKLFISGAFHPKTGEAGTIILLSPQEPGFWPYVTGQPEWDGQANPVDRWSKRVIVALANTLDAKAKFPFGGPPYTPFIAWALESGRSFPSPVTMLVHDTMGLWASFRGALAFAQQLELPAIKPISPCISCETKPCLAACPANAVQDGHYDVPACHSFLDTEVGTVCMNKGCRVRNACPLSQIYGRLELQSAYHMGQFHK